ncbi:hypothetical protein KQX63_18480 [Rhodopseudomonas palustris]|uniref:hypothetical protein n=1 Tax=Rhodopseudomonas palustris TaxID=1076 RepID=UPI0021F3A4F9|nr:hypothetical protein [Rhodopseudomonas palustris]UYO43353.1 hypothetical protein KQX63_18480 [Rhodopseudomonas palustris]
MWTPEAPTVEWTAGPLQILETLYYLDGPAIFTAKIGLTLFLFHKIDETEDANVFLLADVDDEVLTLLKGLHISLRGALNRRQYWIVETNRRLNVTRAWSVPRAELPLDLLPEQGVGLALTPSVLPDNVEQAKAFFSMVFRGEELREDVILFSRFKYLVDSAYESIRKIFPAPKIEDRSLTREIDFPIFQPQLGSLIIAMQAPSFDEESINRRFETTIDSKYLAQQFEENRKEFFSSIHSVVRSAEAGDINRDFAVEHFYTLDQVNNIIPTSENYIDQVEFRAFGKSITIDDRLGDRIRQAYRIAESADRSVTGVIVEVNAESNTFVIKDYGQRQITCDMGWKVFERYEWAVGMKVQVRGQYIKRTRRDKIIVRTDPAILS